MVFRTIQVRKDWRERGRLLQISEDRRWRAALLALAASLALSVVVSAYPAAFKSTRFLAFGASSALYPVVGIYSIARLSGVRRWLLVLAYLLIVLGALWINRFTPQALSQQIENPLPTFPYNLIASGVLLVLSWALLGWVFFRNRRDLTQGLDWNWWITRVVYGLGAGILVVVVIFLSASLGGLPVALNWPATPLLFQRLELGLGIRAPGEELLFRGIIYNYIYNRLGKGFWTATLVTSILNITIYAVQMHRFDSPEAVALALVAPGVMAVASCALYYWEGSLIGPMVNNGIFQVFSLIMGWE